MSKVKADGNKRTGYVLEMVKALIVALIITLLLEVLGAFLVKQFNWKDNSLRIINQVIKGVSVFLSALFCFRSPNNGWVRGIIFGILYIAVSEFVFALLNQAQGHSFVFDISLLNDVAIGSVTGLISGIIAVNVVRNKH